MKSPRSSGGFFFETAVVHFGDMERNATPDRTVEVFPKQDRNPGQRTSSAIEVPGDHDRFKLACELDPAWTPGLNSVLVEADISEDGGQTWELLCGFTAGGGSTRPDASDKTPFIEVPIHPKYRGKTLVTRVRQTILRRTNAKVEIESKFADEPFSPGRQPNSVAFDAAASATINNTSSGSWTHTPSGTPTGVAVGIPCFRTSANPGITSVTYGGQAMAEEVATVTGTEVFGYRPRSFIYGLPDPPSGAQTVAITFSGTNHFSRAGSVTVVGGDTSDLVETGNTATNVNNASSVTLNCPSADDELVLDAVVRLSNTFSASLTVGASQTQRWNTSLGAGACGGSTEPGASSVTMSWTGSGESVCQSAISFKVAAAPDVPDTGGIMTTYANFRKANR